MKILISLLLFSLTLTRGLAQNTTLVLDTTMFNDAQVINLASAQGWVYHPGHNPAWTNPSLVTKGWLKRKLGDLSVNNADKTGRVEGWFRLRLQLDSTFRGMPVWFRKSSWAAADLYIDGRLLASYGSTGRQGKPYHEYFSIYQSPTPVALVPGQEHLIALHLVDYPSAYRPDKLQSELGGGIDYSLRLVGPSHTMIANEFRSIVLLSSVFLSAVALIVALLLWQLLWQKLDKNEKAVIQLLAVQSSMVVVYDLYDSAAAIFPTTITFIQRPFIGTLILSSVAILPTILLRMVDHPWALRSIVPLLLMTLITRCIDTFRLTTTYSVLAFGILVLILLYELIVFRKRLKGAQWAIVTGLLLALLASLMYILTNVIWPINANSTEAFLVKMLPGITYSLAIPLSFLVYVALRFKEILAEDRAKATALVYITEEKRQLLATQNERLELQVEQRTAELKASQAQLIQKEKLASLGELTAGIAHEIQNPLNFVNNFSEVSAELVSELRGEEAKSDRDQELIADLFNDLSSNLQKINHHGGRASNIVKGMLEHSRTESGEKRPTDLNALADEYLKIAYHGLRAKNKDFNCELVTAFDSTLEPVEVAPQEIGRVLLNLYNNAFYAVTQRQYLAEDSYQPTIQVQTKRLANGVQIRVRDNGTGILESMKAKIFQPFFTTKPTGEGTGLGLSLSYDIITKGHGGTLTVDSTEGHGTTFIIQLYG